MLRGYAAGIFPMADSRDAAEVFWVEPRRRAIIPLTNFHCSRSLARRLRSGRFEVTCDLAFEQVMRACADRDETWINGDIERTTIGLHRAGHAHSIECWYDGRLVGGLYGVALGGAFLGESMFSLMTDASKVALAWLVARMKVGGFSLLDCQFMTSHLASLGARQVSRDTYVGLLGAALGSGRGAVGSTGAGKSASPSTGAGATVEGRLPDFAALDLLLADEGLAGAAAPSGQRIAQLLGHTS
ncbi:MAG: leucyl/phenylalanyl-tRNA--protein transferase [Sphingomonas bacterium]|nr:leucyl/phenylalanyl-tRNA--protein transferase [Sphingomonas bacterium]